MAKKQTSNQKITVTDEPMTEQQTLVMTDEPTFTDAESQPLARVVTPVEGAIGNLIRISPARFTIMPCGIHKGKGMAECDQSYLLGLMNAQEGNLRREWTTMSISQKCFTASLVKSIAQHLGIAS